MISGGKGPIVIVTHPTINRAYVANWLSRDVTVIDTGTNSVVTTISTVTSEVLPPNVLNGKQLFYTSTGALYLDGRGACATAMCSIAPMASPGPEPVRERMRSTPDSRGVLFTDRTISPLTKTKCGPCLGILEFTEARA